MTSIGNSAFYGCRSLTSVTIPNSVTSIGYSVFYSCKGLATITIGNSVTSIGNYAFYGCSGLTSVTIPNSVMSIRHHAFYGCSGLASVTIPNSVTMIESSSFYGCRSLTSVTIPNSVTNIEYSAFECCSGLTSVTIPNSVKYIGWYTFSGCSGLTSVTIPNSVTSIGLKAFSDCSSLASVTIGCGVKNIWSGAFASCKELTDVYCLAENVPTIMYDPEEEEGGIDAFQDSYIEYATLHVPTTSIDAYKAVEPWKSFKEIKSLTGEDIPVTPDPEEPEVKKCSTPSIAFVDGELVFSCETEGVEYVSKVSSAETKKYYDDKVKISGTYKVTVYATKEGWDNSDTATLKFTVGSNGKVCDTNKDGVVDVADIGIIIDKMAGK